MRGLEGQRVLVTGAAGGIGTAATERLVAEGARVAAADLSPPELDAEVLLSGDVTAEDDAERDRVEDEHAVRAGYAVEALTRRAWARTARAAATRPGCRAAT